MEPISSCLIEGFGPLPVYRPESVAIASALVRQARETGQAIYPAGGRTKLRTGRIPTRLGFVLDTTALAQVIDYPARDMTITVQAGMRLAELERILAGENQRLPIDVPNADEATVGGILAANTSGPRRLGYGTLRDYLIGISVLDDRGHETKAGGRVVKNVAGYDLCKLHIGARGTLGVITQATFKLRPLSAARALLRGTCPEEKLDELLTRLHGSKTRPVAVEVLHQGGGPWQVVVGLEESEQAVSWQTSQLLTELAPLIGEVEVIAGTASDPLWRELAAGPEPQGRLTSLRANLLPSAVAGFCRELAKRPEGWNLQAHAGSGIVRAAVSPGASLAAVQATLKDVLPLAQQASGNLVIVHCPIEWKSSLPIWGAARGDVVVMRKIKSALDPLGLFNPGRFLEGIEA